MKKYIYILTMLALSLPACAPKQESPKADSTPQNEMTSEPKTEVQQPEQNPQNANQPAAQQPEQNPSDTQQPEAQPAEENPEDAKQPEQAEPDVPDIAVGSIDTSEAQKHLEDYGLKPDANLGKELNKRFKQGDELSALDVEALLLLIKDVQIPDSFDITENKTAAAVLFCMSDKLPPQATVHEVYTKLLYHESPAIRGTVLRLFEDTICQNPTARQQAAKLIEKEENPFVRSQGYIALSSCMSDYPAIGPRLLKDSEDSNPAMRRAAAIGLAKTGKNIPGAKDAIIRLLSDSDHNAKQAACHFAGWMQDESLIPHLTKYLMDPAQESLHFACMNSLFKMWYDYPNHQNTSEAAFNATLEYYRTIPQQLKESPWGIIELPKWINSDTIEQWRARANYFKGEKLAEFVKVMSDIALNEKMDYASRLSAITVISRHDHNSLPALQEKLEQLDSKSKDTKRLISEMSHL